MLDEIIVVNEINEHIKHIRSDVFMKEQNASFEEEFDELDKDAIHVCGYENGTLTGYCRLLINKTHATVGRMCILRDKRGLGYGKALFLFAIDYLKEKGVECILLHAQEQAIGFYEQFGFCKIGEKFEEANITHIKMGKCDTRH